MARVPTLADPRFFRQGYEHIRSSDQRLRDVLDRHGIISFRTEGDLFESLVESILSQQLAGPAASAIISKVRALYPEGRVEAEKVYRTPAGALRSAGVSPQKLGYLRDLSGRVAEGRLDLEQLREKRDEEIVSTLDEVRGIGPWTAQMLLIFTLGRPDVLPVDDLGIRKGMQRVYRLRDLPKRERMEEISEAWHPFCSVASLYLWRHKDSAKE